MRPREKEWLKQLYDQHATPNNPWFVLCNTEELWRDDGNCNLESFEVWRAGSVGCIYKVIFKDRDRERLMVILDPIIERLNRELIAEEEGWEEIMDKITDGGFL